MRKDNYLGFEDQLPQGTTFEDAARFFGTLPTFDGSTLFGIDVSHHNGVIDWKKVKAAGVQYVFLKATEGATFVDSKYATNRAGARSVGIPCGAYHFMRANVSAASQIEIFVKTVGKLQPGDLPPVLDIEVPENWTNLNQKARVKLVMDWLTAVEARLGVRPIVYINNPMARDSLGSPKELASYPLWLAHYTSRPQPNIPLPWTRWTFWQYSESGKVNGVPSAGVDMNRFAGTLEDLQKLQVKGAVGVRKRIVAGLARVLGV